MGKELEDILQFVIRIVIFCEILDRSLKAASVVLMYIFERQLVRQINGVHARKI